ncbi:tripartite tricarboxylate transporter substrate binding protein [Vannielia litorea]|uniref:tripartite tricarboxylate transporter substrate binding protein n=1 Tax=Vannielia litorea TaxID=1217970 RepID=UPI001C95983B|nr:tripartite tricarboxylate transporter substrate binding protein [Vannielia litorea]MBY6048992.1 tripartite tricarboxylate transporter substrate binding protein [Vannielia litorea]MBY6076406.1 tripartite tricarboxylate transporter substrate binding protein [Vannielia litorea]
MKPRKLIGAALALALGATGALAAEWPDGPVQIIVPSKPGGGTDVMARIFADYLGRETGGDVVVVNVDGGGGSIAYNQVMTAAPDGQTILYNHTGLLAGYHTGHSDIGLDDFTTIGVAQSYAPQVYAVAPDAPWDTMKDFMEDARANPGERTVAVSLGRTTHFIAGLIMMNEDVDLKLLEASAEVDKVAAIQGGHIEMGNLGAGSAKQYEQAGDMKVLCLLDPEPHPAYPEYETCVQQGVNVSWLAPLVLWGPKGMDAELVQTINAATAGMAEDATAREALKKADSVFTYYDVGGAADLMASEDAKIKALAEKLGLAR